MKSILRILFYKVCILFDYFLTDNKARILMYHSFELPNVFFNVSFEDLEWQLDYLKKNEYVFLTQSQMVRKIKNKESLRKVVVITCDDGHRDYLTTALVEFEKRDISSTLFWPKRVDSNEIKTSDGVICKLLVEDEIVLLSKNPLVEIGSHAMTHRELINLSVNELMNEVARKSENSFAYPRGKFSKREIDFVQKAGYSSAVTTINGFVDQQSDLFSLPRISIDSKTDKLAFKAKLSTFFGMYAKVRR